MAKSIFGIAPNNANDSDFRAWGSVLSTQLSNMLTRVTTTGDINWTTVTKPSGGGTYQGFEVYRFNDTAQTTHPIFLKFEYGSGSNSTTIGLRLTIGKSCDAAGNIGNILLPATTILTAISSGSGSVFNCYMSNGSGSSLALSITPSNNNSVGLLLIERAVNSNATINGEGLYVAFKTANYTNNFTSHFISYSATTSNTVTGKGIFPAPLDLSTDISLANGTTTPYFPAACLNPSGLYWIPRVALGGAKADCALGAVVTNLLDGFDYIGLGSGALGADQRSSQYASLLMRW